MERMEKIAIFETVFRRRERAFTLPEILIVIGIIVLLYIFVFTAYKRGIESSKSVKCIGQLRQIYIGMQLYMQDNQGEFPPANPPIQNWNKGWTGMWYNPSGNAEQGLPQYFSGSKNLELLSVCPSNQVKDTSTTSLKNRFGYPYVCNYEIMRQNGSSLPARRIQNIQASRAFLLADSPMSGWGAGVTKSSFNTAAWDRLAERHSGCMNVLWADGHVTSNPKAFLKLENVAVD